MASLTIKDVDDVTLERLGDLAAVRNKSLQVTVADILRDALSAEDRAKALRRLADDLAAETQGGVAQTESSDLLREDRAR